MEHLANTLQDRATALERGMETLLSKFEEAQQQAAKQAHLVMHAQYYEAIRKCAQQGWNALDPRAETTDAQVADDDDFSSEVPLPQLTMTDSEQRVLHEHRRQKAEMQVATMGCQYQPCPPSAYPTPIVMPSRPHVHSPVNRPYGPAPGHVPVGPLVLVSSPPPMTNVQTSYPMNPMCGPGVRQASPAPYPITNQHTGQQMYPPQTQQAPAPTVDYAAILRSRLERSYANPEYSTPPMFAHQNARHIHTMPPAGMSINDIEKHDLPPVPELRDTPRMRGTLNGAGHTAWTTERRSPLLT